MTLASILFPERECVTCKNQIAWGCEGTPQIPILFPNPDNPEEPEVLERCPNRPYFENPLWFKALFDIWSWIQKGMLTEPGGWSDQGAKVPILMNVIDSAVAEAREAEDKRAKRKQKADRVAAKQQGGGRRAKPHIR